jgi:nucleoside-diphosphate-sugar epimerase
MTTKSSKKQKKPCKVLVTGGGGFLGGAIVRQLVERDERVRSFSRSFYQELEPLGVEQIQGDISDKATVENACKNVEIVFHVAAKFGVLGNYEDYYKTNVTGTQNVIDACKTQKISRLVYTSSPNVVFDGTDMEGADESAPYPEKFPVHYPKTKALAEQSIVNASNDKLRTIILRPHFIWGPRDNALPRILARAKRLRIVGNGKNLIDTIYIDDAARAHLLAADKLDENPKLSGNIYFISQGEPVPLWGMINNFLKAAGYPAVKRSVPKRIAWLIGAVFELIYKIFHINSEPYITRYISNILSTSHWFDISAAKRDLGYKPTVSMEEGLHRLEVWLKENSDEIQ